MTNKRMGRSLVLGCLSSVALFAGAAAAQPDSVQCVNVTIRGGQEQVCNSVYENPISPSGGVTVLAVHGFTRTAAVWEGFADALFADSSYKWIVGRVIAVDLPGRGNTPATPGFYDDGASVFGTLLINDNISIIIQDIGALSALGMAPGAIMGHSMGGLEIQGVQEALLSQGSSLATLGVARAILLAPVPNGNATWNRPPSGDVTPYLFGLPGGQPPFEFGPFLGLPPPVGLLAGAFTRLDGTLATNLPAAWLAPIPGLPSYVPVGVPADWMGWEPLFVAQQLTGSNPSLPPRPGARNGAFANNKGTKLTLISFAQDVLTPSADHPALYTQLTGQSNQGFQLVSNANATHESFVVAPETAIAALKASPWDF